MKSIVMRAATYDNWTDRIYCFIKGPGWEPGKPRLGNYEEIPQVIVIYQITSIDLLLNEVLLAGIRNIRKTS